MSVGVIPHRTLTTRQPKVISNQRGGGTFPAPRSNFLGFLPRPVRPFAPRPAIAPRIFSRVPFLASCSRETRLRT